MIVKGDSSVAIPVGIELQNRFGVIWFQAFDEWYFVLNALIKLQIGHPFWLRMCTHSTDREAPPKTELRTGSIVHPVFNNQFLSKHWTSLAGRYDGPTDGGRVCRRRCHGGAFRNTDQPSWPCRASIRASGVRGGRGFRVRRRMEADCRAACGGHKERERTLNQIRDELDEFKGKEAVVVAAATVRPDVPDPALLRPGRVDRHRQLNLTDSAAGDPRHPCQGTAADRSRRSGHDCRQHFQAPS